MRTQSHSKPRPLLYLEMDRRTWPNPPHVVPRFKKAFLVFRQVNPRSAVPYEGFSKIKRPTIDETKMWWLRNKRKEKKKKEGDDFLLRRRFSIIYDFYLPNTVLGFPYLKPFSHWFFFLFLQQVFLCISLSQVLW